MKSTHDALLEIDLDRAATGFSEVHTVIEMVDIGSYKLPEGSTSHTRALALLRQAVEGRQADTLAITANTLERTARALHRLSWAARDRKG